MNIQAESRARAEPSFARSGCAMIRTLSRRSSAWVWPKGWKGRSCFWESGFQVARDARAKTPTDDIPSKETPINPFRPPPRRVAPLDPRPHRPLRLA